jgi:hypothetical protein
MVLLAFPSGLQSILSQRALVNVRSVFFPYAPEVPARVKVPTAGVDACSVLLKSNSHCCAESLAAVSVREFYSNITRNRCYALCFDKLRVRSL